MALSSHECLITNTGTSEAETSNLIESDYFTFKFKTVVCANVPSTEHYGKIGFWGSFSIAVNSLTGPAMLTLPATFQRCGLIPTVSTIIFVCFLSSSCSLFMADVISKIPGNDKFEKEVEFSDSFEYFWGRKWFIFTEVVFFICITCLNISSIVDTSQVVDIFFGHWIPGGSAAVQISFLNGFELIRWDADTCTEEELLLGGCTGFSSDTDDGVILTLGYFVTALIFFPMSLLDLQENSNFQILGFVVLLVTVIQFAIQFAYSGLYMINISLWGKSWDTLFGVVLFNFALVIAVPSWLYERHPLVSIPTVVHGSSILSAFLYIIIGISGALSIENVSDNMLESMLSGVFGISMQLGASFFAFMIIGLGIPLFSVLARLNLTSNEKCSIFVGNILAVIFPWSVSWILYRGSAVTTLLAWGGTLFTSIVAFVLPLSLALFTVIKVDKVGSVFGKWIKSQQLQAFILLFLLLSAVLSIAIALFGLLLNET